MLVNPDVFEYGNPQPFGGNIVSHASTYINLIIRRLFIFGGEQISSA